MFTGRVYRTQAVILRRHNLGEADRILTLFTHERGKIRAVAKGIRKPMSRLAGHAELYTQVDYLISQGRSLDVVSQGETVNAFAPLRTSLLAVSYAAHFAELVDAFTEENDANPPLYRLLVNGLGWLTTTADLRRTARYFELHTLDLSGYRVELFSCVSHGGRLQPENQFYSPYEGGVVCPSCGHQNHRARPLSLNALKVLRYMQTRPFDVIEQVSLSDGVLREIELALHDTLTYHLERRLRSAAFLKRLYRESWPPPGES